VRCLRTVRTRFLHMTELVVYCADRVSELAQCLVGVSRLCLLHNALSRRNNAWVFSKLLETCNITYDRGRQVVVGDTIGELCLDGVLQRMDECTVENEGFEFYWSGVLVQ